MVTQIEGKYRAIDIANYFLLKADQEDQELLSNLKLQKLVYYAQGLHLAMYGESLFNEEIEAWQYGPVVPDLYHHFKGHGSKGIPANAKFDPLKIDDKTRDFLDEIYEVFGQFSAVRLMHLAHSDQCYVKTQINCEITKELMQKYLRKYLVDG